MVITIIKAKCVTFVKSKQISFTIMLQKKQLYYGPVQENRNGKLDSIQLAPFEVKDHKIYSCILPSDKQ
jgi:hypothetical protein